MSIHSVTLTAAETQALTHLTGENDPEKALVKWISYANWRAGHEVRLAAYQPGRDAAARIRNAMREMDRD